MPKACTNNYNHCKGTKMKLTRKTLRKLIFEAINESQIKPSISGLDDAQYGKVQTLARHKEPQFQTQASTLASSLGYDGNFAADLAQYDAGPSAFESVMIYTDKGREKRQITIPKEMVDKVIDAYQLVLEIGETDPNDPDYDATYDFREAAEEIFDHIEKEIHPYTVFESGLEVGGYRAKEYQDAMFAIGDYL